MLRYLVIFFVVPIGLFWTWYGLSYFDINFGLLVFSRFFHDIYFAQAGEIIGVEPGTVPLLIFEACAIDLAAILAIWAFRRRREIRAWWSERKTPELTSSPEAGQAPPAE